MAPVGAQRQRLVALEHQHGLWIAPGGQDGRHLPPAELEALLEAVEVDPTVGRGPARQAEEQLAVHLGEARQLEAPEEGAGVVDGAVVGAEDVPGPDGVVVLVDLLIAVGAPLGIALVAMSSAPTTGSVLTAAAAVWWSKPNPISVQTLSYNGYIPERG